MCLVVDVVCWGLFSWLFCIVVLICWLVLVFALFLFVSLMGVVLRWLLT